MRRLAEACRLGDVAALRAALAADALVVCDGGGVVPAALGSVRGGEEAARLVALLLSAPPGTELTVEAVNGRAGLVLRRGERSVAVAAVKLDGARVSTLWIVLNPAKLAGWHRRRPS
ncbi:siderophore-interacting protein [Micromonospora sp. 15K316]|uniref:siderophore-interacting protein n=1 Tax=Micromonospora sp. 15K316 TaxID=2530376 RepID=UPI001048C37E|nr:siderophore-interacting protein [Micromonospora sp. 15K316]TDC39187.1 siderophore-interacting protein [Micromonospora sp. 15K316]